MPLTRRIVYRFTGIDEGRVQTIVTDPDANLVRVHIGGAEVYLVPTFTVEWHGDTPIEVWVPADRYGEWKVSQW